MKFDKLYSSRIYSFFEFLYQLVILNFITILFTIGGLIIFSFMGALIALIIIIRSLKSDKFFPLLRTYISAFFNNYLRVLKLSLFYLILGLIFTYNTYFFYRGLIENQIMINAVFYYLALFIDLVFILSFINACFVYVYFPNLKNLKVIKYSFVLLRVILGQALFILFILALGLVMLYVNILNIIFIFIFISLFVFVVNVLLEKKYLLLVADGVIPLDAFLYIRD